VDVGQIGAEAGGTVVQNADVMTLGGQRFDEVRADETGPAGNQTEFIHMKP
jgi:hypothetical protein